MSLLSTLNRVATKAVSLTAGKEAASVYRNASESVGKASLTVVTETVKIGVGIVDTTASALPAATSYIKGLGLGVLEETELLEKTQKFEELSSDEKGEMFRKFGALTVTKLRQALAEDEQN